ncbi:MAG: hypothetical protein AB1567_06925 [bacterium]
MMTKKKGEGMLSLKDFEDNPSHYIYLRPGQIVYESLFEKNFNGNLKLLLDSIEDNIFIDEEGEEKIDYDNAIRDYLSVYPIKNIEEQR